jgi:hypothetical protein
MVVPSFVLPAHCVEIEPVQLCVQAQCPGLAHKRHDDTAPKLNQDLRSKRHLRITPLGPRTLQPPPGGPHGRRGALEKTRGLVRAGPHQCDEKDYAGRRGEATVATLIGTIPNAPIPMLLGAGPTWAVRRRPSLLSPRSNVYEGQVAPHQLSPGGIAAAKWSCANGVAREVARAHDASWHKRPLPDGHLPHGAGGFTLSMRSQRHR